MAAPRKTKAVKKSRSPRGASKRAERGSIKAKAEKTAKAQQNKQEPPTSERPAGSSDKKQADETVLASDSASHAQDVNEAEFSDEGEVESPGTEEAQSETSSAATATEGDGQSEVSPFDEVAGKFVRISEIAALTSDNNDPYFSSTVLDTLQQAQVEPRGISEEGYAIVDPWAYLRAAILQGAHKSNETQSWRTAHEFLADWFSSTHLSLAEIGEDQVIHLPRQGGTVDTASGPIDAARARDTAVAHPDLTSIIAEAVRVVGRTDPGQRRIDARHLLVASLVSDAGRGAIAELGLIDVDPADDAPFADLASGLYDHISNQAESGEDTDEWQSILDGLREAGIPGWARRREPVIRYYPHFNSDDPVVLTNDALGVADDARAMAELICLKNASPPLAIGLFGDWGAGKSTFMEMLEEAIGEVTERTEGDPSLSDYFVRRVAHIRFNAWHYMDANLWASLVAHLFKELHRQSRKPTRHDWLEENQFDRLLQQLDVAQEVEKQARSRLETLESEETTAKARLGEIEKDQADARKKLISEFATSIIDKIKIPEDKKSSVTHASYALGLGSETSTARQLKEVVEEATSLVGTAKLLWSSLSGDSKEPKTYLKRAAAVLFLALALVTAAGFVPELQWVTEGFGAIVSLVAGAGTWLVPHLKFVNQKFKPLREAYDAVARTIEEKEERRAEDKANLRKTLEDLRAKQAETIRQISDAKSERQRLEAIARGDRPTELLLRFIEDRATTEDYRKHLGLLNRVRQDFGTMSRLMREQRQREREGKPPDPKLPAIDRIVLYIDDLDRCQDKQVVHVLEAVHLLLAFDLFVVVVGVDARWLRRSLTKIYSDQLAGQDIEPETVAYKASPSGLGPAATANDYLEKIFQIPFWLRPLNFAQGGSYGRLVNSLVASQVISTATKPDRPQDTDVSPTNGKNETIPGLTPVEVTLPEIDQEETEATLERITITDKEFELMQALGPLAGKSPRAVKRFVNLYRLIRVRRREPGLSHLVDGVTDADGQTVGPPEYPAIMFWLAAEVGLPARARESLQTLLEKLSGAALDALIGTESSNQITEHIEKARKDLLDEVASPIAIIGPHAGSISSGLTAVSERLRSLSSDQIAANLLKSATEPARYTFRHTGRGLRS